MYYFHGYCPWIISIDFVHCLPGQNPWIPWKNIHGHTGKNPWTFSMETMEIDYCFRSNTPVHGIHGVCPLIPWSLSTDSMDFLQMD